jgi:hypothetical protein
MVLASSDTSRYSNNRRRYRRGERCVQRQM